MPRPVGFSPPCRKKGARLCEPSACGRSEGPNNSPGGGTIAQAGDPCRRITKADGTVLDLWSARDAVALNAFAIVLQHHLRQDVHRAGRAGRHAEGGVPPRAIARVPPRAVQLQRRVRAEGGALRPEQGYGRVDGTQSSSYCVALGWFANWLGPNWLFRKSGSVPNAAVLAAKKQKSASGLFSAPGSSPFLSADTQSFHLLGRTKPGIAVLVNWSITVTAV